MPAALVARVIAALADGAELVVPVLPVTDTVKMVDGQGTIRSTVDRAELRITQYPFGVTVSRLGDLHTALGAGEGLVTVAGDADAVPVDLPADAALANAIIACRS
jgi:2-C-methyl-D-erythritol 4-phosphate cytidylyltransferase